VHRLIADFHQDEEGDWVAELDCLHDQHVRHKPPFQDRPWVLTEQGRREKVGADLNCPLCDRAELPDRLRVARTAGPWDETTLPAGLRRAHRVAAGTWGRLCVLEGSVRFWMATNPMTVREVDAGESQPIPPMVEHEVRLQGPVRLQVEFLVRPGRGPDYRVRGATLEDVAFLTDVSLAATRDQGHLPIDWDEAGWRLGFGEWTEEQIRGEIAGSTTSVIEVDGAPVGRLRVTREAGRIELSGIQLLAAFRGHGIGTAVVLGLQAEASRAGLPLELSVDHDNPRARALYERLGFVLVEDGDEQSTLRWTG
jgi:ribosomal protein S18 acetylase RimI-like enzyme/tellurite resistance-related uncharacterized protein